jgi:hypothetical protein
MTRLVEYSFAPTALDADGVCASQTLGAAGDLTINGALASAGVATLGEQAKITLASAANYSAVTFTVYGTSRNGNSLSESMAGPNNNTVTTTNSFNTVTRIASSAALATAITAGNSNALETAWVALDPSLPLKGIAVELSATVSLTYEVQYAAERLANESGVAAVESTVLAVADGTLTAKTATATLAAVYPWLGIRLKITSYASGSGTLRVIEAPN